MQSQSSKFRPQATKRLFLAIVNQAISDVLENGKEAKEAERWLLSKDFDALDRLFGFPVKPIESLLPKRSQLSAYGLTNRRIGLIPSRRFSIREQSENIGLLNTGL